MRKKPKTRIKSMKFIRDEKKEDLVMVMKLIFHVENDENTKKKEKELNERPKQCCQLPSHANVRATVAKPMITHTDRSF